MKNKLLVIFAVLMALFGIVWLGQGIGAIGGSVMTNETRWAVIGAAMIIAAAGIAWFALARRSR